MIDGKKLTNHVRICENRVTKSDYHVFYLSKLKVCWFKPPIVIVDIKYFTSSSPLLQTGLNINPSLYLT